MMDNFSKSDVLLTPEIVKSLPARVHEEQSRLVRRGVLAALAGDSPSPPSFTCRVYDAFTDGDYTSSPAWTVESGTWSAATGALVPVPQSGARAISTANTYGNADVWYAFKRTGTGGIFDNNLVQVRYVDENNWLGVRWGNRGGNRGQSTIISFCTYHESGTGTGALCGAKCVRCRPLGAHPYQSPFSFSHVLSLGLISL
jgi:hypothetical protein